VAPLLHFMNAWAGALRTREDVHAIRYEDLRVETEKGFARSLSALGHREVDSAAVRFAVELASFERQRQAERQFRERRNSAHSMQHQRARRGVVGGFRDELSPADVAFLEQSIQQMMDPYYAQYLTGKRAAAA
jgi:hypothetical protein